MEIKEDEQKKLIPRKLGRVGGFAAKFTKIIDGTHKCVFKKHQGALGIESIPSAPSNLKKVD